VAVRGRPIPSDTVRLIAGLRMLRYPIALIARHLGLSRTSCYKYLAKYGHLPCRRGGKLLKGTPENRSVLREG
jgi:hypothetical protein